MRDLLILNSVVPESVDYITAQLCRASINVSHDELSKRLWKLLQIAPADQTPGAQSNVGGVRQRCRCETRPLKGSRVVHGSDRAGVYDGAVLHWYHVHSGKGVKQDYKDETNWYRLAPSRMQRRSSALVSRTNTIEVQNKTLKRWSRDTEKQPSRSLQMRSPTLVTCTPPMETGYKEAVTR